MGEVVITDSAFADLEDIENYISLDSPAIARRFILKIFDKIDQLYEYPLSGKPVPEIQDNSIYVGISSFWEKLKQAFK